MNYYLCLRHPVRPRSEWTVTLQEHLDWMRACHEAGTVVISGPSRDRSVSLYLIRAMSRSQAEEVAASDPFTAGGECRYELIEWEIHQVMGIGDFVAPG
jgi:uncharacterized protein YciI